MEVNEGKNPSHEENVIMWLDPYSVMKWINTGPELRCLKYKKKITTDGGKFLQNRNATFKLYVERGWKQGAVNLPIKKKKKKLN